MLRLPLRNRTFASFLPLNGRVDVSIFSLLFVCFFLLGRLLFCLFGMDAMLMFVCDRRVGQVEEVGSEMSRWWQRLRAG